MDNPKKILLTILCVISSNYIAFSQNIGINTTGATPADCSMLDVVSSTKGMLIPRVALTDVTLWAPLTGTAVDGVIVYSSTAPTGGGGSGYYYWSTVVTAHWVNLLDNLNPGTPWLTFGNTGLTNPVAPVTYGTTLIGAAENWMGTIDAKDIVFGTDNKERMRIMKTNGFVGIGTAVPSTLFHINGGTASTTQTIATITANSLTSGKGLFVTSSSLTSGNLVEIQANNATSNAAYTSSGLYVKNDAPYGNAIQAVSAGLPNYSAIFADETPAGAGSGYSISLSNHAIAGQINGTQAYSFGVYGRVVSAPNPSGGVLGYYGADDYGALGYFDGSKKGVYGLGADYGVYGTTLTNGGTGVFGINTSTGVGSQYGVYGTKTGATGTGTGYAIYGTATGTGTNNIGAYFTASGATNNYGMLVPSGGGFVGIGTIAPTTLLHVSNSDATSNAVLFENTGAAGASGGRANRSFSAQSNASTTYTSNTHASGTGVDGAGQGVGGSFLVAGSGGAFTGSTNGLAVWTTAVGGYGGYFTATGTGIYTITSTPASYWGLVVGAGSALASGQTWSTSDRRFKKDIITLPERTIDKIMKLNPCQYSYDSEKYPAFKGLEGKNFGLIAQELEKIFPELVNNTKYMPDPSKNINDMPRTKSVGGEEGVDAIPLVNGYYTVDYVSLIPILIKGMQEQEKMIEDLKKQNEQMSKQLKDIKGFK